jgi:aminoglycoside phosphotransferase (APT) family kinase protein
VIKAELDAKIAAMVLRRVPGTQSLVSAERLSGGASQETYRLVVATESGERKLCLRRALTGSALAPPGGAPGLATEAALMKAARAAGVPEPEVLGVLDEDDALGAGFVMEWLEGETLGAKIVRDPAFEALRPRLAFECGAILARLHRVDLDATGLRDKLERMTPEVYIAQTWTRYRGFETPQPMIDFTARWLLDHLPEDTELTLVHNDFRTGNLMIGPNGVVGVLDWELAHVGDPMRDLGWLCTNSWRFGQSELPVGGFGTYEDLFRGYESVSGKPVDPVRVRFWEVFGSFWWAVACLAMAEAYRTGLDRSVERAAVGRRSSEAQIDCVNLLIPGQVDLCQPPSGTSNLDLPRLDELVTSVRDYLRTEVMARRRTDVSWRVLRPIRDAWCCAISHSAKRRGNSATTCVAWSAATGSRNSSGHWSRCCATDRGLASARSRQYLPESVVNQTAIDPASYSGLKTAVNRRSVKRDLGGYWPRSRIGRGAPLRAP